MVYSPEKTFQKTAHDIAMEFLRRNAPSPLREGVAYALSPTARVNALVEEYLTAYKAVVARLEKEQL